jgi:hypothetical protein
MIIYVSYFSFLYFPGEGTKMNIVIGSSRTKGLNSVESLKSNKAVEVWTLPGGKYNQMSELVDQHLIYCHGGPMPPTEILHFYIVAGLCDVTKKLNNRNHHYTEVTYKEKPQQTFDRVIPDILNLKQYILSQNAMPIFCTIIPSHIQTQNNIWFDRGVTTSLCYAHEYDDMQSGALEAIRLINEEIPKINLASGLSTPYLHQTLSHKSKGKRYFQYTLLSDGCHAGDKLKTLWAKCLNRAIKLNRS